MTPERRDGIRERALEILKEHSSPVSLHLFNSVEQLAFDVWDEAIKQVIETVGETSVNNESEFVFTMNIINKIRSLRAKEEKCPVLKT